MESFDKSSPHIPIGRIGGLLDLPVAFAYPEPIMADKIHLVGVKGTGMTALAELLQARGDQLTGSDGPDKFFTDEILDSLKIPYHESFAAAHVPADSTRVVYSAAYSPDTNPELLEARRLGLPLQVYPEALGDFSMNFPLAAGIAGVHGKTTTTAMAGVVARALGLPASVLVGSLVPDFGNRATLSLGRELFIAETCEYKRHFLHFHPGAILLTSVELDHTDYFRDEDDIFSAFLEYGRKLPAGGLLVYCADEPGATRLAKALAAERPDVHLVPYGLTATGAFAVVDQRFEPGVSAFRLAGWSTSLGLSIPGSHNVLNATGACALVFSLAQKVARDISIGEDALATVSEALRSFRGTRRRSQIVGQANGVLVIDDYGHHPTAIGLTLRGLKAFYPGRRLVLDFMSHTYSRTKALLAEFAASFDAADLVILHKIYASARETDTLGISGRTLFDATCALRPGVEYFEQPSEALPYLRDHLKPGDLLVTMGAGDNWKVGREFLDGTAKGVG